MSLKVSLARVFSSPHAFQYISPSRQQKVNRDSDMNFCKVFSSFLWELRIQGFPRSDSVY